MLPWPNWTPERWRRRIAGAPIPEPPTPTHEDRAASLKAWDKRGRNEPEPEKPKTVTPPTQAEASKFIQGFESAFDSAAATLIGVAGEVDADVEGRLKDPNSLIGKVITKNRPMDTFSDIAGLRATTRTVGDADKVVDALKKKYGESNVKVEDKIRNPKEGYRAIHIDAMVEGKPVEIQVRTRDQSRWAIWMHDTAYKPSTHLTDEQRTELHAYSLKVSAVLYAKDSGKKGTLPACPSAIVVIKLCFDPGIEYYHQANLLRRAKN